MLDRPVLSEIECGILIGLLFFPNCKATCREVAELSHISDSTWHKEKKSLLVAGLIEIEDTKGFDIDGKVVRRTFVKLTQKGKLVACLLADTSNVLMSNDESLIDEDVQVLRDSEATLQLQL